MKYILIILLFVFSILAIRSIINVFRDKCHCMYHQTNIEKSDPLFGGRQLFICENCHHEKWIHIDEIENIFAKQSELERLKIPLSEVYIRKVM